MPRYADISDSEPIIPKGFTPGTLEELDAESMAELRLPREPIPPTGATGNTDPEWDTAATCDCCWLRSAISAAKEKGVWFCSWSTVNSIISDPLNFYSSFSVQVYYLNLHLHFPWNSGHFVAQALSRKQAMTLYTKQQLP